MESEFDKEINALLRQAARSGDFVSTDTATHLDADEISLFAENALPAKGRAIATEHLADCNRCRKILSNVISLNAETESETIHAKEVVTATPLIPWYKKFFAFPQMAYTMGALALIFSGVIAFMVLQNVNETQNSSVARVEQERPQSPTGAGSDGATTSSESYSTSNATSANSTSNTSTSAMSNSNVSVPSTNSNAAVTRDEKQVGTEKDLPEERAKPKTQPNDLAKRDDSISANVQPNPSENNFIIDGEEQKRQKQSSQGLITQNNQADSQDSRPAPVTKRAESSSTMARKPTNAPQDKTVETRIVGGKTFRRDGGAWIDSAYKGQSTTNVSRGTDAYRKLDAGLRSIAENLGGTVIVVLGAKAYRIQ